MVISWESVSNVNIFQLWEDKKNIEVGVVAYFEILSQHSNGNMEKIHGKL
jgi:hypothetical protein